MTYEKDLARIVEDVVAPQAARVDAKGVFSCAALGELAAAGILGLTVPAELGGGGRGLDAATDVVRTLSQACGSTAMVVTMHYAATAVLAATGREDVLREIAQGRHLSTLAFSETGSRSHFWAPLSTATAEGDEVVLDAAKSWVTSAHHADSYVWSSRPLAADGPMSLWFVRTGVPGLGPGAGFDLALTAALPWFLLLNAAAGAGLMESVTAATAGHLTGTRLRHLGQSLAHQVPARAGLARMRIETDRTRALDFVGRALCGLPLLEA
ncbi:alkylation response protein AidB-like acyl-CoA dehydrogenase [Amycolatopsis bartoniae]|uniref:Acyl-CoA dehydrogenase n=1 Tax=Amycolatopsis bartoniae TaxID=941986 RepID=A0A8H9MC01_9PSEU|nr:acyl-CoA dehydrogenase family protein [Amycolatopsis bartoniae]MBB2936496.1 alkylation response protein AidB-like acyl-CoA dehydrogenase [Amycolatopsis bartoniae]TVT11024.1 hypothetical protein FNH07_03255 [Amycolatopsis bartoniae]GHF68531.1 acyl-CoA dehydrogenase [Amycolatopsis bartoniae]